MRDVYPGHRATIGDGAKRSIVGYSFSLSPPAPVEDPERFYRSGMKAIRRNSKQTRNPNSHVNGAHISFAFIRWLGIIDPWNR